MIFTDRAIARLRPGAKRQTFADPQCPCLYLRVTPKGHKSFVVVVRGDGKQYWLTLGRCDVVGVLEARTRAREIIGRVGRGEAPIAPRGPTVASIAALWRLRHVEAKGLRSGPEIARVLDRYVLPVVGDTPMSALKRSDVVALLDRVEDSSGARTANYCLSVVRSICNWHAARDDRFVNPIVRGMRRGASRRRDRILNHNEIRAVWAAAEASGTFGAFVQMLLLTAQRKSALLSMKWGDLHQNVWTMPLIERAKGVPGKLPLPKMAMKIINQLPKVYGNEFVFAGRGDKAIVAGSASKALFDVKCGVSGWSLHDLRRTARTLMGDAGVHRHVAERVLGHALPGVEGVYDRGEYRREKAEALQKLADLLGSILGGGILT